MFGSCSQGSCARGSCFWGSFPVTTWVLHDCVKKIQLQGLVWDVGKWDPCESSLRCRCCFNKKKLILSNVVRTHTHGRDICLMCFLHGTEVHGQSIR